MKAWRLHEPGTWRKDRLHLEDIPKPEPDEDEVRVQVQACGLCHTDLHLVKGEITPGKTPIVPGHQIVGVVDRVGEGVKHVSEGDQVGIPWLGETCGYCEDCMENDENLCKEATFTGCDRNGGYAPFTTALSSYVHPVSADLDPVQVAPLLCGGVIGLRALKLSEIQEGERLGLYGFGSSASMVIQMANARGCDCYVFTRSEHHMELAKELDAVWTGTADEDPGVKMHGSILFAPAGHLVLDALEQLRQGSTLSIAGIYLSSIPEMSYQEHLYRERSIRSVTASTRQDVRDLLQLASDIDIETQVERVRFECLPEGLDRMEKSQHNASPVLCNFGHDDG